MLTRNHTSATRTTQRICDKTIRKTYSIGSNLFNVFFVLGCSASLSPLPMGNINNIDMAVLVGSSILFWLVGWFFKKRTITRIEGGLLVVCYIAYTAFLISQQ